MLPSHEQILNKLKGVKDVVSKPGQAIRAIPNLIQDTQKKFLAGGVPGLFQEEVPATYSQALKQGIDARATSLKDQFSQDKIAETASGFTGGTAIKSAIDAAAPKVFEGFSDLSTKLLEKLKGRSSVSRQFISDLTNAPDLKQTEKDLIRRLLDEEYPTPKSARDYGMSHRPNDEGPPAYDLLEGDMLPRDVYDQPDWSIASGRIRQGDKSANESWNALQKIRGNPKAEVTVYRAGPKNELNDGDWISLSPSYAKGESLAEGVPVHSFKVKASDVRFAGDDINEFGYYPTTKAPDIDVPTFAEKVKAELLPLERANTKVDNVRITNDLKQKGYDLEEDMDGSVNLIDKDGELIDYDDMPQDVQRMMNQYMGGAEHASQIGNRYENVNLPDELRGPVANYSEHIYRSPVKTSAGDVHFSGEENYFGHTRVEDLPDPAYFEDSGVIMDGKTRRVIEVQSDLMQRSRLDAEFPAIFKDTMKAFPDIDQLDIERYIKECL